MAVFRFKQFQVDDHGCGMKVCTDSVLLGAWAGVGNTRRILDLGCGCGLLALMMAQRAPQARIFAIDINQRAIDAATANFAASPWAARIEATLCDAAEHTPDQPYDLIVCNPPYFSSTLVSPDADRAQARHAAGLSAESALEMSARWLSPDGSIALVTPPCDLVFPAEMLRLRLWRKCAVSTVEGKGPTRLLWQFGREDRQPQLSALSVRRAGEITPECHALTQDFYL